LVERPANSSTCPAVLRRPPSTLSLFMTLSPGITVAQRGYWQVRSDASRLF
jgi:hypothetical protein